MIPTKATWHGICRWKTLNEKEKGKQKLKKEQLKVIIPLTHVLNTKQITCLICIKNQGKRMQLDL